MRSKSKSNAVFVFSKAPELGKVKTRLARSIGDEAALNVYQALLKSVVKSLYFPEKWDLFLSAASDLDHPFFNSLFKQYSLKPHLQEEGDLGVKMLACLNDGLNEYKNVIIVGGDAVSISLAVIEKMFVSLESTDISITPSEDGGYIAIGANATHSEIFDGINWGTETVFDQQMEILKRLKITCVSQEKCWDLDEIEDFNRAKRDPICYQRLLAEGLDPRL